MRSLRDQQEGKRIHKIQQLYTDLQRKTEEPKSAQSDVDLLIHEKFERKYTFRTSRSWCVYALDIGKSKEKIKNLYNDLQDLIENIRKQHPLDGGIQR